MTERFVHQLEIEYPGAETPAETRERLREHFPRGSLRRMTQLGLLVGRVLEPMKLQGDEAVVYASAYGESRTLEEYLASFPTPSPTLFQTSIHPSAVQQALIARQRGLRQFYPLTGGRLLGSHALQTALQIQASRTVLCGGEERGSWLLGHGVASEVSFAFAFDLSSDPARAIARIRLEPGPDAGSALSLPELFYHLRDRLALRRVIAPGLNLALEWL